MANPAPTITNINAFNAESGTIIDFNIIGGTEIVRSNKIYIYDLEDNSLICTHLYVSTESMHELPPNDDSSIVYASGKSATDFVNGKQYYACIQTFTNTAGTEGFSGISLAKLFWCLDDPSATFTFPSSGTSTIDTTSCNAIVSFNTNVSTELNVTNAPQQYEFILYTSVGAQVATSGVIIGSGEQVGTTNVYNLSYNFTGLENNKSYYIRISVTTTEGMFVTSQTDTFLINAGGVTLGAATAINDACGGYINIVSNLSESYDESITKVLVKRRDINDVTGAWITLYSKPIYQASDMNFTVIDFLNVYGKEYSYAIVPIFLQNQVIHGETVQVEVEGGYTLSNEVNSYFDGVFVCDSTAIQKFVAGVNYNDTELHQAVGVIETIGSRYPVIVSNSNMNYYTGTIGAYTLGEGFYKRNSGFEIDYLTTSNNGILETDTGDFFIVADDIETYGNLDREEIVAIRQTICDFLTNKKPKIIKDWNGNIFLVAFTDNVRIEFTNEWGMGLSTFSAGWTEIGKADDQYDLENCGIIDLGGV